MPPRIISLLPSATEIVCSLGLGDWLVGRTHECDYPGDVLQKPVVTRSRLLTDQLSSREIDQAVSEGGAVYELAIELISSLEPGLILTQGLCDVCAVSHSSVRESLPLLLSAPRVLTLSPARLADVLRDIKTVGDFTDSSLAARTVVAHLRAKLDAIAALVANADRMPRVACLEWLDPPWTVGHWVPGMVGLAGGVEVLAQPGLPSRRTSWDELADSRPELVVLMPCGFDLERACREAERTSWPDSWRQLPAVLSGQVWAVDGSGYFNRPGPRLFDGVEILARMLHPRLLGGPPPSAVATTVPSACAPALRRP